MKTKSKLVLGLSILGAATMAAGATSTFAWYTLTTTGNIGQALGEKDLTTVQPSARSVGLPLDVVISSGASLEMVTYKTGYPATLTAAGEAEKAAAPEAGAGWYHAYYDGTANRYQKASLGGSAESFLGFTVTVKAPANHLKADGSEWVDGTDSADLNVYAYQDEDGKLWNHDDIATEIATNDPYFKVVASRDSVGGKVNRVCFYGASASEAVNALPANMTNVNTTGDYEIAGSVASVANTLKGDGYTFYFGVFIEGEKGSTGADDASTIIGDFTVTVSTDTAS